MSAAAIQQKNTDKQSTPISTNGSKPISWDRFQKKYLTREDGYKYEWVEGKVEKTKRAMDKSQLYILRNLQQIFRQLLNEGKIEGELISEPDLFFLKNHRRPDICWLTDEQIDALAEPEGYEVPAFIIEVISTNDQANRVQLKMKNYRESGVKVVWKIFPIYKQVEVWYGDRLEKSILYEGNEICTAAPVLPAMKISVNDIFYLKKKKTAE